MANFDFSKGEHIFISDSYSHRVYLTPQEALDLLQWLSAHQEALSRLTQRDINQASSEKYLEIHLYQENLEHLDELKAAIPELQERRPVKVLNVRWDAVTERALQLLKEFQLEYSIHPLLIEEEEAFAQG